MREPRILFRDLIGISFGRNMNNAITIIWGDDAAVRHYSPRAGYAIRAERGTENRTSLGWGPLCVKDNILLQNVVLLKRQALRELEKQLFVRTDCHHARGEP